MTGPVALRALARLEASLQGRGWVVALILLWLAFSVPSLQTYPSPDTDEAMFSTVAVRFYEAGEFRARTARVFDLQSGRTGILHGRLYAVLLGGALQALGVGVFQARLVPLAGAALSGLLVRSLGRALGMSRPASLAGMALFLVSWRVFFASHSARPESWIVLGGVLLAVLYLRSRRSPTALQYGMVGFVAGYLLDLHVPFVFFSAATSAMVLLDFARRRLRARPAAAYAVGALLGLAAWAALWLLPNPASELAPWRVGPLAPASSDSILAAPEAAPKVAEFSAWLVYNFIATSRAGAVETGLVLLAALGLAFTRRPPERFLLAWGGFILLSLFASPYRHDHHDVFLVPAASLLVARFGEALAGSRFSPLGSRSLAALLAAAPLGLINLAGDLSLAVRSQPVDYASYAAALQAYIPPGATVLGEEVWWFTFRQGDFVSDRIIPIAQHSDRASPDKAEYIRQVLTVRKVDYVLLDGRFASAWRDSIAASEAEIYPVYEQVVMDVCAYVGDVNLPLVGAEKGGPADKRTTVWRCPGG